VGSWEAPEQGGGACEGVALAETYKSSIEKTKSMNLYKSENRPAGESVKWTMGSFKKSQLQNISTFFFHFLYHIDHF
jgi:hypothetical protein